MTGTDLKGFIRETDLTVKELSNWLEMEAEQMYDLLSLGKKRLPMRIIGKLRPVLEKYNTKGRVNGR